MEDRDGSAGLSRTRETSFTSPARASRAPRRANSRNTSGKRTSTGFARTDSKQTINNNSNARIRDNKSATEEGRKKTMDATAKLEVEDDGSRSIVANRPKSVDMESGVTESLETSAMELTSDANRSVTALSTVLDLAKEMPLPNPSADRPLSAYLEVVDPENFDSKHFLSSVNDLLAKLSEDRYRNLDPDMPTADLEVMVRAVSATLSSFQGYAVYAQTHAERLRDQMKSVKDHMLKKIQQKAYDPSSATERLSLEERELEAKLAQLNKDLARTAAELARACAVSAESETSAMQAALVAEQASAQAARTQAEYEARRNAELEKRCAEEERLRANVERQLAEAAHAERLRRKEDARRARLRHGNARTWDKVWEKWPIYSYGKDIGVFDHGVTAVVRADPALVKESWVRAEVLDQRDAGFVYRHTEQLVSNVVRLGPTTVGDQLPVPVYVALPHCTSRVSAMTREPVMKSLVDGLWVDLKSQEVTLEDKKDVKFVQAEVTQFTTLAVVTRFKRDFLQMPKGGGKETSNVDSRVTFLARRGTFKQRENFVLQLQPVDSVTVSEVKARPETAGLLCASSIVNLEWTSPRFNLPVTMTLPCPPNPVKAQKAAAVRAAKEAKMKNPGPSPLQLLVEARKREEREEREAREEREDQPPPPKYRWYMGQYSMYDDENDILYMVSRKNGKWKIVGDIDIFQARLDLLQFDLPCPIDTFMVLRTRPTIGVKEVLLMADTIESHLSQSLVIAIVKQSEYDHTDLRLNVGPLATSEGLLRTLENDGYGVGPAPSSQLRLREGDVLEVNFRGNITCRDDPTEIAVPDGTQDGAMTLVYNSHLGTSLDFSVTEVDRFLQKNYSVFRGFVQVFREVRTTHTLTQADMEEGRTHPCIEVKKELITELLITIPKEGRSAPERGPAITKAPIVIKNINDPINEETLRDVAAELGGEWKRLAQCLNVKRMRIQAIMRNCRQNEDEDCGLEKARFEMLLTWVKKVPRGVSKIPILCQALVSSGRGDLAERLSDLDKEFHRQRRGP